MALALTLTLSFWLWLHHHQNCWPLTTLKGHTNRLLWPVGQDSPAALNIGLKIAKNFMSKFRIEIFHNFLGLLAHGSCVPGFVRIRLTVEGAAIWNKVWRHPHRQTVGVCGTDFSFAFGFGSAVETKSDSVRNEFCSVRFKKHDSIRIL